MQCLANTLSECMITYAVFKSAAVYVLSARFPSPRQTHLTAMLTSLIGNHHSPDLTILGFAVAAIVVLRTSRTIYNRLNQLPLPPGPKPWPILGNISDFPKAHEGRFWATHKEKYGNHFLFLCAGSNPWAPPGPISSVSALGSTFIILNDLGAVLELLDKRSSFYSSRYESTFSGKMYISVSFRSKVICSHCIGSKWS